MIRIKNSLSISPSLDRFPCLLTCAPSQEDVHATSLVVRIRWLDALVIENLFELPESILPILFLNLVDDIAVGDDLFVRFALISTTSYSNLEQCMSFVVLILLLVVNDPFDDLGPLSREVFGFRHKEGPSNHVLRIQSGYGRILRKQLVVLHANRGLFTADMSIRT